MNRRNLLAFRLAVLASVVLAVLAVLAGCQRAAREETYDVGAVLPQTGNIAFLGEPVKRAINLATQDINGKGGIKGRPLRVIYEDSKGDPKTAVIAMNKLTSTDNVPAVISFQTGVAQAIQPIADKENTVLIALSIYPRLVESGNTTFRIFYDSGQEAEGIVKHYSQVKPAKVVLFRSTDSATDYEVNQFITPKLKSIGVEVEEITFEVGQKDMKSQVAKLKASNVSHVVLLGFGSDFPNILKEMEQQELRGKLEIVGGIGFVEVPATLPRELLEGVIFFAPQYYGHETEAKRAFAKKFESAYGTADVSYAAAYAYDAMMIFAQAANKTPSGTRQEIAQELMATPVYTGVTGPIEILPDRNTKTPIVKLTYKGGVITGAADDAEQPK